MQFTNDNSLRNVALITIYRRFFVRCKRGKSTKWFFILFSSPCRHIVRTLKSELFGHKLDKEESFLITYLNFVRELSIGLNLPSLYFI